VKAKDFYPAVFSRHAGSYMRRLDCIMSKRESRGRLRVIELIAAAPGERILELACGPGTLSQILATRVAPTGEVVGVDLAPGMISLAASSAPANATFLVMDIERLEFPDHSFDAAACGHGLQFAPDLGRALGEAHRVLRPRGRLAASVPIEGIKESVWDLIDDVAERWLPPPPQVIDARATRATVTDADALCAALFSAGFDTASVEVIDEEVLWDSAEQLVSMFMGWWDFAYRIEGLDAASREAFRREAIDAVRSEHPGVIKTMGRSLVAIARAA
jgi:ubiquinone/menaquinone biosynthesis C-methylase UbiE